MIYIYFVFNFKFKFIFYSNARRKGLADYVKGLCLSSPKIKLSEKLITSSSSSIVWKYEGRNSWPWKILSSEQIADQKHQRSQALVAHKKRRIHAGNKFL